MATVRRVKGIPLTGQMPLKAMFQQPIFVDSSTGASDNDGTNAEQPVDSISTAFDKVAANGVIIVLPGHSESVTAAAGIDADVAGVHVLGLGEGTARPTVNFTTATGADIDIDAANITFENLYFDATGIDALTGPIDVNAAYFTMKNCQALVADSGGQCADFIVTDANADYMTLEGNVLEGTANAGAQSAIQLIGTASSKIVDNRIYGDFAVSPIECVTTASTRMHIEANDFENLNANDVAITLIANTTGTIKLNTIRVATDGQVTYINGTTNCALFENYGVNNDGETGQLDGSVSS